MIIKYKNEVLQNAPDYQAGDGIELKDSIISVEIPTRHLSQAEYDVLTDEDKQKDILYVVDEPEWIPVSVSVQDYDTEDGWHVRKYSDGYCEMVYKSSTSFITESIYNGSAHYSINSHILFPFALTEKYSENICILSSNRDKNGKTVYLYNAGDLTKTSIWAFYGWLVPTSINIDFSISITGRWK